MGEAASPLRASKDPTSSGLLQWRWPGTTVPMGAAPMRCIGAEGNRDTAFSTGWGVRTPPFPPQSPTSPICCCCLQEGDKAKQEAHDEPSKHKSISSPVTRVGYHQSLMLGGLHPPWRGSAAGSRREARRCWRGAGRGSPALQKHLGWVPSAPHSAAGADSPARAFGDGEMLRKCPAPALPADAGAWQDAAGRLCRSGALHKPGKL